MFVWRVMARTQTSGRDHDLPACRDPHRVETPPELHAGGEGADCGRGVSPRRDREGRGPAVRDLRKPAVSLAPTDADGGSDRRPAEFRAGDDNGLMYQPPPEPDGIRSIMPHGRGVRISR